MYINFNQHTFMYDSLVNMDYKLKKKKKELLTCLNLVSIYEHLYKPLFTCVPIS